MDRMSEEVESHESNTKKHLNDIKEVLVRLTSMISDANAYSANVVEYDGSLPFKMEDIMAFYNGYKSLIPESVRQAALWKESLRRKINDWQLNREKSGIS